MSLSKVLLPQPEGPKIASTSGSARLNEISSRTCRSWKAKETFLSSILKLFYFIGEGKRW
jgi:hypothetical protein